MRYLNIKRFIGGSVLLLTIIGVVGFGRTDNPPSKAEEDFAKKTSELLHNELVAALFQEFNETTPENVEQGKQAISLIFNNSNRDMRLIGIFSPLQGGFNDFPTDSFEWKALGRALQGLEHTSTERVGDRWYYRTSFPLSNKFHSSCVLCHSNFADINQATNPGQWVGALTLRVPINQD